MLRSFFILLCLCVLLLPATALAQTGGPYSLTWSNVGAAGSSSGGAYTLTSSVGQPDAGTLSGGSYTLSGGFLGGAPCSLPQDINGDGQVTVLDIQADAAAWRMVNPVFPYDQDQDGDVDVRDVMLIAAAIGSAC
ncbi:hypothetical protein [Candidatus Amarolinea aalborgensis]|jgi:hypothetical protein|uniref:hypothetical protein n=1 Tax=Candidatus Amarolinea aalborgensis TaxID=2249329 RepID=UPI003BF9D984